MKSTFIALTTSSTLSKLKLRLGRFQGAEQFQIVGMIDLEIVGQIAGMVLGGRVRYILVFVSVKQAYQILKKSHELAIVGLTFSGGRVIPELLNFIE